MKKKIEDCKTLEEIQNLFEGMSEKEQKKAVEKFAQKVYGKQPSADPQEYLTTREVGLLLHLSRTTIWRYEQQGILKPYLIGNKRLFARADIDELLKKGGSHD